MSVERYDFVAVGSGLAGLTYALSASKFGSVCVLTKAAVTDANTSYAQGGIAAAIGEADSWELHERDTLIAGAGLCNADAVRFLVQQAPDAIQWLQDIGAKFDVQDNGELRLGLEGGHSRHRIIHFEDRTGYEIERAVVAAVKASPNITVIEHAFVTNLLMHEGRCVGVRAMIEGLGEVSFLSKSTLIATGGCGTMYRHTTNPRVATADGVALASEVGAEIAGMEFMQFHPTTLYHEQLRGYLLTEACRGAGGTLRNHLGRRFMYDYDERLELAPRDIVARAIDSEIKRLGTWCVYLDLTHFKPGTVKEEFPTIHATLSTVGVEFDKDWAPVVPAQHYSCGGVITDLSGKTSVPGLYAAGEVASTGVHGANRLASNSLLEAMVFGRAAAQASFEEPSFTLENPPVVHEPLSTPDTEAVQIRRALQRLMTDNVGIVRTNAGLDAAETRLAELMAEYDAKADAPYGMYALETRNLLLAAGHVIRGAISRRENVGLHYNTDLIPTA
ncbi:MAG: L-aspartate oxidase [Fimbriimonadaceae bacterium]|nr:L-aspartate oxidase [Fimbriimonadaceae bacterium]